MTDDTKQKIDSYINELWDLTTNSDNLTDLYNIYEDDTTVYERIDKDDILKQMFVKIDDIIKNFKDEEHEDILNYLIDELGDVMMSLKRANNEDKQVCIAVHRFEALAHGLNCCLIWQAYHNHRSIHEIIESAKFVFIPQHKLITYIKENHREAFEDIITKLNSANILQPLYDNREFEFEYKWLGSVLDFSYFVALMNGKKFNELYIKEEATRMKGIQWQIFLDAFEVCDGNGKLLRTSNECSNKYSNTFKSNRKSIDFNNPQNEKDPYLNCYKIHKIVKETNKTYFQK